MISTELGVYGSSDRGFGDQWPDNDLDPMVECERRGSAFLGFVLLALEIKDALGIKVQLVEEGAVKSRGGAGIGEVQGAEVTPEWRAILYMESATGR